MVDEEFLKAHQKTEELKKKLDDNEDLNKQIESDKPIKKLGISSIVTVACLGICMAAKLDKKIVGAAAAASFVASFIIQKWKNMKSMICEENICCELFEIKYEN